MFFGAFFCIEKLQCVVETFLACFFCIFNFWPKVTILQRLKPLLGGHFWQVSKCSHVSNISCFFEAVFCIEQLQCVVETFLACFFAFLIFDPKWRFCKGYSLFLLAIFGHFQISLIFRILAVFSSRFLHRTTAMCCRNVFSMFFCIFNFWPKVTILQRLKPLLGGHFWQVLKCSHVSNIRCFLELFFA